VTVGGCAAPRSSADGFGQLCGRRRFVNRV
jgi:hypothetical protein